MKVLVTGSEGYLGSLLSPYLAARGHAVVGVDTGFYKVGRLYPSQEAVPTLDKDIRHLDERDLEGADAVVHMAELSNDPLSLITPDVTYEINHLGSVALARLCKTLGIARFVYTSSCSVYGVAERTHVCEDSPLFPQTPYAVCKTLVERDVSRLGDDNFSPTFLRNATAFGASPRMRFDIVLNNLAGLAWVYRRIGMTSDGTPWRPLVHALDICKAIACVLEAPREEVHNELFNVGDDSQNYQIRMIADILSHVFPDCIVAYGSSGSDKRSYRVSFEKIRTKLPGFSCEWDALRGARQLRALFEHINMDEKTFNHRGFTRLKQLQYLLRTHQVDEELYWAA
jgi:nucleoside-diphosphate-sugar epimerase